MLKRLDQFCHVIPLVSMLLTLAGDAAGYLGLCLWPSHTPAAENLFLRKQLALYQEPKLKPRPATNAIRIAMVWSIVKFTGKVAKQGGCVGRRGRFEAIYSASIRRQSRRTGRHTRRLEGIFSLSR